MWNPFSVKPDHALAEAKPTPITTMGSTPGPGSRIADIQVTGGTAIATVSVNVLSQDEGLERLAELLVDLEETGATDVILDIQNVEYLDSACIGCLVESLNRMTARGGRIALVNPAHRVTYLFKLARLDHVFRICSDVMAALDAIEQPAE